MSIQNKTIPVLLLTGYLGSGKTTLLNRILHNTEGIRFAVIVNDIGEVNIDADMIQRGGIVGEEQGDLVALQNGCICCTLKMDLVRQIDGLLTQGTFDYIVIEASGICEPAPIAQTICAMEQAPAVEVRPRLDCIATVVDALRLKSEFASGESLTRHGIDEEDIENLIIEQIEFCNLIILNKISEVSEEDRGRIRAVIRSLQPDIRIIECDYCDIPLSDILNTHLFDFDQTATSATWVKEIEKPLDELEDYEHHDAGAHNHKHDDDHEDDHDHETGHHHHHHHHHDEGEAEEYGISTFVYYRRRPFDFDKFDHFVNAEWPRNVIRAKGVLYFSHNRDMSILFEQAGVQKTIKEAGYWYATAPAEELEILMEREPGLKRDWDEEYGDRMIKLVFIGRDMDRKFITDALDRCLA